MKRYRSFLVVFFILLLAKVPISKADGACTELLSGLTGIGAGNRHTCFLKYDGNVECRGDNYEGSTDGYQEGDAISVAAGNYHTCFLKSDGDVTCNGLNFDGQADGYYGGDAIGVAAGYYHTCFLKNDGNVECIGDDYYGKAYGYYGGDAIGVAAGKFHTCFLKIDGNVECNGYNSDGQADGYNGGDAIGVAVGYYHTCFLKSDGNVECKGVNTQDCAEGYQGGDAVGVAAGYHYTCVLKSDGNVECKGYNSDGQADGYNGGDAIGVAAGYSHTCFLKSDGNVECSGNNFYQQSESYEGGAAVCTIPTPPDIVINPLLYDFGNVCWMGDTQSTLIQIANAGKEQLNIIDIQLTGIGSDFAIIPLGMDTVPPGSSVDLEVTFSPSCPGYQEDILSVVSDDPDEPVVEVLLAGLGVLDDNPSALVADVIAFIDDAIYTGGLVGVGKGKSADKRANALKNMIEAFGNLVEDGLFQDGCIHLTGIYEKVDGDDSQVDFVCGPDIEILRNVIQSMLLEYCSGVDEN